MGITKEQARERIRGADDFMKLLMATIKNLGILNASPLSDSDSTNLADMLIGIRKIMMERYEKEVLHG